MLLLFLLALFFVFPQLLPSTNETKTESASVNCSTISCDDSTPYSDQDTQQTIVEDKQLPTPSNELDKITELSFEEFDELLAEGYIKDVSAVDRAKKMTKMFSGISLFDDKEEHDWEVFLRKLDSAASGNVADIDILIHPVYMCG